jgi:hypothetical protein
MLVIMPGRRQALRIRVKSWQIPVLPFRLSEEIIQSRMGSRVGWRYSPWNLPCSLEAIAGFETDCTINIEECIYAVASVRIFSPDLFISSSPRELGIGELGSGKYSGPDFPPATAAGYHGEGIYLGYWLCTCGMRGVCTLAPSSSGVP